MNEIYDYENRVEKLHKRKLHCCCKYCGQALELRPIIFSENDAARVELYCPHCRKIEFGVEKEIYAVAEYFVEEIGFQCYTELNNLVLQKQMNIAKVADIISWGFVNLGYINENGFCYPIKVSDVLLHESLNLTIDEWQKYKGEVSNEDTN